MTPRARSRASRTTAYGRLADAYDLIHAKKPYAREAREVRRLVRASGLRPSRSLLDVACGSGRHLAAFTRWFDCAGLDASEEMLARARHRAPEAELYRGRMERFDLGRQFDVVTCLFSAIGYARSVPELERIVANLARHTVPGGLILLEPWLEPSALKEAGAHPVVASSDGLTVLRLSTFRRAGDRSIFAFHHLLWRANHVEYLVETHDLGLFGRPTMEGAFRAAGLAVRYHAPREPFRRGLYIGRRAGPPLRRRP